MTISKSAVYVLLRGLPKEASQAFSLLVMKRNGGWGAGQWSLPSGHVEQGESIKTAAIRETREEIGIELKPENLKVVHCMYRPSGDISYTDFYVEATSWCGQPENKEPSKCSDIAIIDYPKQIPTDTLPNVIAGLNHCFNQIPFETEDMWKDSIQQK